MNQRSSSVARILGVIAAVCVAVAALAQYWPVDDALTWLSLDAARIESAKTGKPVYLDVYADWCGPCRDMERNVFVVDSIKKILQTGYVPARLNLDDPSVSDSLQQRVYRIRAIPTSIVFNSSGKELKRRIGYLSPLEFKRWINDSSMIVFGSWEDFPSARIASVRQNKSMMLLVVKDRGNISSFEQMFVVPEVRRIVADNFVPTMVDTNYRLLLDSLGIEKKTLAQNYGIILVLNPAGDELGNVVVGMEELVDEKLFLDKLKPYTK
jgi:thioredoxin 1